ncbi:uncharacterized protein [Periplaneta americana]
MAPFQITNEKKIVVLTKIREEKDILFGGFSDKITKSVKIEKWKEIHNLAQSIELVKNEKDWTYTRDVLWPNIKRSTMAKIDNSKKTGAAGGIKFKQNDVNTIVLDIIGNDSNVVHGLGVEATWEEVIQTQQKEENESNIFSSAEDRTDNPPSNKSKRTTGAQGKDADDDELRSLKKRKLLLQIEHLQLINEKTRLEIAILENGSFQYFTDIPLQHQDISIENE